MKFDNAQHAIAYKKENSDNITDCHAFNSEEDYNDFTSKQGTVAPVAAVDGVINNALSPEQNSTLLRMKRWRIENTPTRCFSIHFKNTTFSKAVVLFMDVLDYKGVTQYTFKADDFKACMSAYVNDHFYQPTAVHTKEIINNIEIIERRDKEKGENDIDKNAKGYIQYKIASFFLMPTLPEINSMDLEEDYIRTALQNFGKEMISIMSTNLYNIALKEHISSYSLPWAGLVCTPTKGPSLQEFIRSCSVTVHPLKNYTDFIISDKTHIVRGMLARHDQPIPKYINDKQVLTIDPSEGDTDDDSDSDNDNDVDDDDQNQDDGGGAYSPHFNIDGGSPINKNVSSALDDNPKPRTEW